MGPGVDRYAVLVQIAQPVRRRHHPLGDEMASRYRAELGLQLAGDVGHRGLDLVDHAGTLAFEPLSHIVRGFRDQLLEYVAGDVLAQPELLGKNGIAFGALDHVEKAEIRETRAIVSCDRLHDLLIAARHQLVRDRLVDRFSFRDREQMGLAFDAGVGDQGVRLQPLGLPEDGTGDLDLVVKGKLVDDIDRGLVEAGDLLRKLRARRDLDLVREPPDDLAKSPYLLFAVAAGAHQVGGMPQRPQPAFRRSTRDRLVKILQARFFLIHFGSLKSRTNAQSSVSGSQDTPNTRFFSKGAQ